MHAQFLASAWSSSIFCAIETQKPQINPTKHKKTTNQTDQTLGRNKDVMTKSNFSTWDPRKLGKPGVADPLGPQYDEIPYGDPAHLVGSGRGMLPEVPSEYAQVPMVPARMGKTLDRPGFYNYNPI